MAVDYPARTIGGWWYFQKAPVCHFSGRSYNSMFLGSCLNSGFIVIKIYVEFSFIRNI